MCTLYSWFYVPPTPVVRYGAHITSLSISHREKHSEPLPQIYDCFVNGSAVNFSWWRHQMETFSALLAMCAGNSPVPGEFPTQRPVTRSFDVYFDLRPDNRLSKQSWGWWFETLSHSLWRRRNVLHMRNADILRNMHTFLVWLVLYWWQHYAW